MRLLICTQAVDTTDPVLGFFHGWIVALAKHAEHVHVVCLKKGEYRLPSNVSVLSLGKPSVAKAMEGKGSRGILRAKYVWNLFRYIWSLRNDYDSVFVHMNEEYVLLAGVFWRLLGKRIVLWRNHKKGSWRTRLAARLAHTVCYTSPEAYAAVFSNAKKMPIGIDTTLFRSVRSQVDPHSILFLGRLDAVKHPDVFLEALSLLRKDGTRFTADVYGDPTPGRESFAKELKERFSTLQGVTFYPSIQNEAAPALYSSHAIYVNLTPSGSFDKTLGEALACGTVVVAANDVLRGVIPNETLVDADDPLSTAAGIRAALSMDEKQRTELAQRSREYVEREHSLALLTERLLGIFMA